VPVLDVAQQILAQVLEEPARTGQPGKTARWSSQPPTSPVSDDLVRTLRNADQR
jgi:hypothetical protein